LPTLESPARRTCGLKRQDDAFQERSQAKDGTSVREEGRESETSGHLEEVIVLVSVAHREQGRSRAQRRTTVAFLVVFVRVFWVPFPGSALRFGAYRGRWTSWTVDGGTHSQTRALSCGLVLPPVRCHTGLTRTQLGVVDNSDCTVKSSSHRCNSICDY
jgi:hypothetical protein